MDFRIFQKYGLAVNLGKITSEISNENSIKSSVESDIRSVSTNTAGTINNNKSVIKGSMTNARASYVDAVRTPSHREIVRREMSMDLLRSEGQALGNPSEQSLSTLAKI